MRLISVSYTLEWYHKIYPQYQFTRSKKCFNVKTNRKIKMVLCGGSLGFCIKGKFQSLTKIHDNLTKIPIKRICPFNNKKY